MLQHNETGTRSACPGEKDMLNRNLRAEPKEPRAKRLESGTNRHPARGAIDHDPVVERQGEISLAVDLSGYNGSSG